MNNDRLINIICEELEKRDVLDIIKKDKDFEKRVRQIVSDVIVDMYRVLWQHNSVFKALGNK